MLRCQNSNSRPTAAELMKHPWIMIHQRRSSCRMTSAAPVISPLEAKTQKHEAPSGSLEGWGLSQQKASRKPDGMGLSPLCSSDGPPGDARATPTHLPQLTAMAEPEVKLVCEGGTPRAVGTAGGTEGAPEGSRVSRSSENADYRPAKDAKSVNFVQEEKLVPQEDAQMAVRAQSTDETNCALPRNAADAATGQALLPSLSPLPPTLAPPGNMKAIAPSPLQISPKYPTRRGSNSPPSSGGQLHAGNISPAQISMPSPPQGLQPMPPDSPRTPARQLQKLLHKTDVLGNSCDGHSADVDLFPRVGSMTSMHLYSQYDRSRLPQGGDEEVAGGKQGSAAQPGGCALTSSVLKGIRPAHRLNRELSGAEFPFTPTANPSTTDSCDSVALGISLPPMLKSASASDLCGRRQGQPSKLSPMDQEAYQKAQPLTNPSLDRVDYGG